MSSESVKVRLPDGTLADFHLDVSEGETWAIEYQSPEGARRHIEGSDLYEALQELCTALESAGCQLLCAGARPDVAPSGMSRSMGDGRRAYVMHLGKPASMAEMVDIFDYAEPELVGTVEEQRAYFEAWIESLGQRM